MNLLRKIKNKAQVLREQIQVVYYVYRHPGTGLIPKLLIAFTLGYVLSPVDLIPDFIPVIGYLDDLILVPALIALSLKMVPENILAECRAKAKEQPLRLKDNWVFGILFLLIWIIVLTGIIRFIVKLL